ncbi:MAG: STAS/SEC14 domain-containing protein [Stellaceae bacterium]
MLELIEGLPGNVVGIAVSGRLTMQDCQDVLVPAMQKSLKRHDKIRLYYELNSRFPGAAWDELDLGLEHASRCERVAIVTDIGWVRLTVKALRFLIPSKIRVFATDQAEEGRSWIAARPGSRADTDVSEAAGARLSPPPRMSRSSPARRVARRARPSQPRRTSRAALVDHAPLT